MGNFFHMTPEEHKKFIEGLRKIAREIEDEMEKEDNEYLIKKAEAIANRRLK